MGKKYDDVDPRKASEAVLDEELAKLELPGGGSLAKKIRRIREYVNAHSSTEDCLTCDTCGGLSCDELFDRCPYCGDDETDLDPDEPESIDTTGHEVIVSGGKALDVSALDECVRGIQSLQVDMWGNYHEICLILKRSHDDELWRLRVDERGSPVFKNFVQWAKAEIGIDRAQAYRCIGVAAHCSAEDVREFGVGKLGICFAPRLPSWVQEKLVEEMRSGAKKRELEQRKAELLRGGSEQAEEPEDEAHDEQETSEDEEANAPETPPAEPRALAPIRTTVALTLTQQILPMYARKTSDDEDAEPARSITDDPWAELVLENNVVMRFRVTQAPDGTLAMVLACERLNVAGL